MCSNTEDNNEGVVKCEKCNNPMITMSGTLYLVADDEPYKNGVFEEAEINEVDVWCNALYCAECQKTIITHTE